MTEQARQPLAEHVIDGDELQRFAQLSGDYNPMHLDPVHARRLQFGGAVVHGVFATLRALDTVYEALSWRGELATLRTTYHRPVMQGARFEVLCDRQDEDAGSLRIEVLADGRRTQLLDVTTRPRAQVTEATDVRQLPPRAPEERSIAQAEGLVGQLELAWDDALARALFPTLAEHLPAAQLAGVLGLTNLVGMHCPGLHSVFMGLQMTFDADEKRDWHTLDYRVGAVDARFSRVLIDTQHRCGHGRVEALFRPSTVSQASMADARSLVSAGEFSDRVALVVGGSRGLGEATAKLLAAGGARVAITYAKGAAEAAAVTDQIVASGGRCEALQFDVLDGQDEADLWGDRPITHVYYFASPRIEKNDQHFDCALFRRYCAYYVDGVANLLAIPGTDRSRRKHPLCLFMPSSVFIEEGRKGFAEYIAAKLAAESLGRSLADRYPKWTVQLPRLPQLLTDQTAGAMGGDARANLKVLLAALRQEAPP